MEVLRHSSNAWGQEVLEGISWDLIPVFFGIAVVVMVAHAVFMRFFNRKNR